MSFRISDKTKFIAGMTIEEKASLLSGKDFWYTKAIDRLGIESWMMTDGPHGMRKQSTAADHVGLNESVPSTCFPSGSALAATWNPALIGKMGEKIGLEARSEQVRILLGPAVNIKRSPLCGRNFEYLSEDPYLAGELAKAHIRGIQSTGVGTSIKHFAVNNQEKFRMVVDAIVDERTLREIYLPAFEAAIKIAKPWTVMCAYNKLNGTYCSQNKKLLNDILRTEWDYDGVVMTDWSACDDRVAGLLAGQDLEMPGNGGVNDRLVVEAVRNGTLAETELDRAVERLLVMHERAMAADSFPPADFDVDRHHEFAHEVANEAIVLLKNDGNILPIAPGRKLAVIGEFAKKPRYQGGGSSHINPTRLDCLHDALAKDYPDMTFSSGYRLESDIPDSALIAEAVEAARSADVAILCAGLTDTYESEGFDRTHMRLPASHNALIQAVASVCPETIVILSNGSPVEMPWLRMVSAVVEGYLAGQAGGKALADILTGKINPSGKLAETFPIRLEDTPCFLHFPGNRNRVEYREGIFVGYRHYDSVRMPVLFPFGFGLSYTSFAYSDLALESVSPASDRTSDAGKNVRVSLTVTNTGKREGKEIIQIYVHEMKTETERPEQELKGFSKITLAPGASKRVTIELDPRAFSWYDSDNANWRITGGDFEIRAGSSSRDIRLAATISVAGTPAPVFVWTRNHTLGDMLKDSRKKKISDAVLARLNGMFGNSTDPGSAESIMMETMFREMPLRGLALFGGQNAADFLERLLDVLNEKRAESDLN